MNTKNRFELPDGSYVRLDGYGYMLVPEEWNADIAEGLAKADDFDLTREHWEILFILRAYFEEYELEPPIRALTRLVAKRLGNEKANSRHLYRLFPGGPVKQGCRYAGLPLPLSCI